MPNCKALLKGFKNELGILCDSNFNVSVFCQRLLVANPIENMSFLSDCAFSISEMDNTDTRREDEACFTEGGRCLFTVSNLDKRTMVYIESEETQYHVLFTVSTKENMYYFVGGGIFISSKDRNDDVDKYLYLNKEES